jgi:hypothetical protein
MRDAQCPPAGFELDQFLTRIQAMVPGTNSTYLVSCNFSFLFAGLDGRLGWGGLVLTRELTYTPRPASYTICP